MNFDTVSFFISDLQLKDLLDLLLLYLTFYQIFRFAERSGVVQVLAGFGLVAGAFYLSEYFELLTFHTVLESVFRNLFIVVALIFQTEIRRGLSHLGSQNFFRDYESLEQAFTIDELSKSLIQMSKKGVGAIIIFENKIDISSYTETGVKLMCDVKSEIIQAVFHPSSAVHDGAMVVKEGRIVKLGTFLPLSTNPALDKNLGTRHRAALGVTELTDAKVVVVSEESKKIALVESGKLRYLTSKDDIHTEVRAFIKARGKKVL